MEARWRPAAVVAVVLAAFLPWSALGSLESASGSERLLVLETANRRETFPASAAGELSALKSEGGRQLKGLALGARTFPLEDLLCLQFPWPPQSEASMFLYLRAGGKEPRGEAELAGTVVGGDESFVEWRCPSLGKAPFKIRLEDVKGLLILGSTPRQAPGPAESSPRRVAAPPASRKMPGGLEILLRDQIRTARKDKDEVVLLEKGKIEGILQSLDATGLRFNSEKLGDIKIPYDQVRALLLAEVGAGAPPGSESGKESAKPATARVRLGLKDSSQLGAELVDLSRDALSLRHGVLGDLKVPLGEVLEVAFKSGRASYLSDRDPTRVREESGPLLQLKFPFRRDSSVLGEPMKMGGTTYRKGLGVHSYSCLEFDLAGEFSRFRATVGLDESARPDEAAEEGSDQGSVVFRVKLDGKVLFEKGMTWRDPPAPVELKIEGGKLLGLEVDYGPPEGGYNLVRDRADWAEARVVK
jgi:hypothetical protein